MQRRGSRHLRFTDRSLHPTHRSRCCTLGRCDTEIARTQCCVGTSHRGQAQTMPHRAAPTCPQLQLRKTGQGGRQAIRRRLPCRPRRSCSCDKAPLRCRRPSRPALHPSPLPHPSRLVTVSLLRHTSQTMHHGTATAMQQPHLHSATGAGPSGARPPPQSLLQLEGGRGTSPARPRPRRHTNFLNDWPADRADSRVGVRHRNEVKTTVPRHGLPATTATIAPCSS